MDGATAALVKTLLFDAHLVRSLYCISDVIQVAWHPTEPKLLVSSGQDGLVAAFSTDGTRAKVKIGISASHCLCPDAGSPLYCDAGLCNLDVQMCKIDAQCSSFPCLMLWGMHGSFLQDIRHSTGMLSCAWHPKQKWVLATTSDTGPVYTWNLNAAGSTGLLQTLNGHTKKSFGVAWSPLLDNMLLTGSDDATARVWDVRAGTCCALLVGHRTEVRALCWHPEVPWMVFTGRMVLGNPMLQLRSASHSQIYKPP